MSYVLCVCMCLMYMHAWCVHIVSVVCIYMCMRVRCMCTCDMWCGVCCLYLWDVWLCTKAGSICSTWDLTVALGNGGSFLLGSQTHGLSPLPSVSVAPSCLSLLHAGAFLDFPRPHECFKIQDFDIAHPKSHRTYMCRRPIVFWGYS